MGVTVGGTAVAAAPHNLWKLNFPEENKSYEIPQLYF